MEFRRIPGMSNSYQLGIPLSTPECSEGHRLTQHGGTLHWGEGLWFVGGWGEVRSPTGRGWLHTGYLAYPTCVRAAVGVVRQVLIALLVLEIGGERKDQFVNATMSFGIPVALVYGVCHKFPIFSPKNCEEFNKNSDWPQ